ncbi:RNA polymerase subunit sigma-70 [Enterobacter sp. FS01]|nr:RNA polymerase subunit sigma-70 [Leclercia adecarboxylata ATCC 23216 = NBRC 102595]PSS50938.1 RNA polymerase subunit sigma-70 [Enterobacter sp. FS01]
MENIDITINQPEAELSIRKLILSLVENNQLAPGRSFNAWELCEQLSPQHFMALKKNVYFADLLRAVQISASFGQTDTPEESRVEHEEIPNVADEISVTEPIIIPSLSTKLDDVQLPDRFLKLIKRMRNISLVQPQFVQGETLGEFLLLSSQDLAALPGVGSFYIETFEELQRLAQFAPAEEIVEESAARVDFTTIDISQMRLSLAGVDAQSHKVLEKYADHLNIEDLCECLSDILYLEREQLSSVPTWGKGKISKLLAYRDRVRQEIIAIHNGEIDYEDLESLLIVPKKISNCTLARLEEILLEDIESYFIKIPQNMVDIAQRRWGFVEARCTLEEIATDYDVTREYIRLIEAKTNRGFLQHLRVSQQSIWEILEPEISPALKLKMEHLYSCFSSEQDVFKFLDMICGQENLNAHVYPEIDKTILNTYFAENGAPAHIDDIREYLPSASRIEIKYVDNAIHFLALHGVILLKGDDVYPQQLKRYEASACVLINHEKGLPWMDIAKLVNAKKYSRNLINEDLQDHDAFTYPDYIYLSGKGTYKHTSFIDVDADAVDNIFLELMEYAQTNSRTVFHLNECYHSSSNLRKHDYYVIRHFVKNFGEDYGFYFDGRSQSDSVGLEKGFKNITQKDVIIEAMNNSERPLTKPEIAHLLKSKSLAHASFYMEGLIEEGKVVQVDRMLYTTPECAYKNIDIDCYVAALEKLLVDIGKPVEPSIFKDCLNILFERHYSKYFYASLARLYAKERGWHRKHSLYSIHDIPFKNMKSAMDDFCDPAASLQSNIDVLQWHIEITRDTAAIAIQNWRNAPSMVKG